MDNGFSQGTQKHTIKKEKIFNKWCCSNWMSACRGMQIEPYLSPYTNQVNQRSQENQIH